ncbi:MFS transporter [Ornithinimicrobium tianjinense]|uniref:MFS transporter n=1 Tax=Ornithinimicrobium tianjinense TaxID=1195761 RepID=UPI001E31ECC4|nr:MFS transporter [Ornithinimicrobium tianjinense]
MILRESWRSLRSLPSDVRLVLVAAGVNQLGAVLEGFLLVYLVHAGLPARDAALAVGGFAVGTLLGAPVGAAATSRLGPRTAMAGALGTTGVLIATVPLAASTASVLLVAALALVVGVSTQAFRPASSEALSRAADEDSSVFVFSAFRVAMNAGALVAPVLAAAAIAADRWVLLFVLDGVTSLLAAGVVARTSAGRSAGAAPAPERATAGGRWSTLLTRRRVLYAVAMLTSGVVYAQTFSTLPLQLSAVGHGPSLYAAILSLGAVTLVVLELPVTTATRSWPVPAAVLVGTVVFGLSFALYGLAPHVAALVLLSAVLAVAGTTVSAPRLWSFPSGEPEALRPAMFAVSQAAFGVGMALGPVVGVSAWRAVGEGWWAAVALVGVVSALAGAYGTSVAPVRQGA